MGLSLKITIYIVLHYITFSINYITFNFQLKNLIYFNINNIHHNHFTKNNYFNSLFNIYY